MENLLCKAGGLITKMLSVLCNEFTNAGMGLPTLHSTVRINHRQCMAVRERVNTEVLLEPHHAFTLIQRQHLWSAGVAHADIGNTSVGLLRPCPVAAGAQGFRDAVGFKERCDRTGSLL